MHSAPAVEFPLGRSHFQTGVLSCVLGLSGAVVSLWWVSANVLDGRYWLALACWLLAACWMVMDEWQTAQGTLSWGGGAWSLLIGSQSVPVVPQVVLDFQSLLLLRLQSTDQASWVWVDRSANPVRWLALRRALQEPVQNEALRSGVFWGHR